MNPQRQKGQTKQSNKLEGTNTARTEEINKNERKKLRKKKNEGINTKR